jgi:hypothetical protein
MRGLLSSVVIMTLLVCGVQSSAHGAEFDTKAGLMNAIENFALEKGLPGPLGDIVTHIKNSPQYTKTGLIVWLNRKMADAASAGQWKKHDRYLAFYTCISKGDCAELRVLHRQGGGTIHRSGRSGVIDVISATYGWNCREFKPLKGRANTVGINNARAHIAGQCNGKKKCQYTIYYKNIGDPAYGCEKDYEVDYRCSPNTETYDIFVEAEAGWGPEIKSRTKTITLSCE